MSQRYCYLFIFSVWILDHMTCCVSIGHAARYRRHGMGPSCMVDRICPSQDTKLGEAEDFLEVYKAVFEDEEMAKYSDGELAVNLFRVSDIFYRFIALKSKIKPDERSGWVRFWTGHRSVEYIIDASHPAFKRLKDIIWRLRGKADQRLKNLNPTVEVLQGMRESDQRRHTPVQIKVVLYVISVLAPVVITHRFSEDTRR